MRSYTDHWQRQRAARLKGMCSASPLVPGAPPFLRQESGFGYVSSDGRRGCQEQNVPGWKRRLIVLSWTVGKMALAEQEEENVLAVKIKVLALWYQELRAP